MHADEAAHVAPAGRCVQQHSGSYQPAQWGSLQDPRRGRFFPPIARFCSLTRVLSSSKPRHSVMICLIEILDFENISYWPVL